jgi:hypothetical protein
MIGRKFEQRFNRGNELNLNVNREACHRRKPLSNEVAAAPEQFAGGKRKSSPPAQEQVTGR